MNFEIFFRFISYAAVFCGFLSLWVSDTFGIVGSAIFLAVWIAAWFLEGSRWQISELVGTVLIVLALPVFYLIWKNQLITPTGGDTWIAGILSRLILSLTAIKLLQRKTDRDWIFLYLMSFFEVLLAAGLSISALYLGSFIAYLLVMVCAIIAFEIRKTSRAVKHKIEGSTANKKNETSESQMVLPVRRLPLTAITLIAFIVSLAMPLFFMLPRVGGAGFGGDQKGISTSSGFSDSVTLGRFGRIEQSDEIVMRVRFEGNADSGGLYFRGIALDTFDNRTWSRSKIGPNFAIEKGDRDLVQVDVAASRGDLLIQTIYLEPLDTPTLFALPRPVGVQSSFPAIYRDPYGFLSFPRNSDRVSYKVISDRNVPTDAQLRVDDRSYTSEFQNYLYLPPVYDPKIEELATQITANKSNTYDRALAVESYLKTNFGYTLDQKANGEEPLSDFLFNVREGHCEYFATAMAIMLRTQGIATRVINGYHGVEYNETAGVTIIRQRNAHSWVEVYFPGEKVWVTFDPTPLARQNDALSSSGFAGTVKKYIEALETFWIQYFVSFDDQEQQSLARSLRSGFADYQATISSYIAVARDRLAEWVRQVRGDKGLQASLNAIGYGLGYIAGAVLALLLFIWLYRKIIAARTWQRFRSRFFRNQQASIIEFYERMQKILSSKGFAREPHQTPLEFAFSTGNQAVVSLTKKYNAVRFGELNLSLNEADEIKEWLESLKTAIPSAK